MSKSSKVQVNVCPSLKPIVTKVFGRGVTFNIDADSESPFPYTWEASDKILTVFPENLNDEEKAGLVIIIKEYHNRNLLLLPYKQEQVIEEYIEYSEANPNKDTIEFFTSSIPANDLDALKMSLFMRDEKNKGNDISALKKEIRETFGPRGAYIANLCTAGYFERSFKAAKNKLSIERFKEYYELRVGKEAAAIFVHGGMTILALRDLVKEKIDICQLNGIFKFSIHGFGRANVELIKEYIENYSVDDLDPEIKKEIVYESPLPNVGLEYEITLA
ncbi:MAG: hypothetical protein NTW29_13445 [Bacteroidetes bacterium]|nr:hypothetical protein [Bacteroidota bacterium]